MAGLYQFTSNVKEFICISTILFLVYNTETVPTSGLIKLYNPYLDVATNRHLYLLDVPNESICDSSIFSFNDNNVVVLAMSIRVVIIRHVEDNFNLDVVSNQLLETNWTVGQPTPHPIQ